MEDREWDREDGRQADVARTRKERTHVVPHAYRLETAHMHTDLKRRTCRHASRDIWQKNTSRAQALPRRDTTDTRRDTVYTQRHTVDTRRDTVDTWALNRIEVEITAAVEHDGVAAGGAGNLRTDTRRERHTDTNK